MPPVALAIGDPNGIGPEIAVKAALAAARAGDEVPLLVGDAFVIDRYVRQCATDADRALAIVDVPFLPRAAFAPGTVDAAAGAATVAYVGAAVELVRSGAASAIVACPHSETAVNAAGIAFTGYPSLLARLMHVPPDSVFLLLVGGGLRIVHATLHERMHDALARLAPELIERAARAAIDALRALGIDAPRIGIFGINPHAGEGGLFGDDDSRITAVAAARLRDAGFVVDGPTGADVLLVRRECDVYVAAYHDQGHIPIKLLAPRDASALAIGGGIVFSSVGHGSAFDIAGRGIADPSAVVRTLGLFTTIGASRQELTT